MPFTGGATIAVCYNYLHYILCILLTLEFPKCLSNQKYLHSVLWWVQMMVNERLPVMRFVVQASVTTEAFSRRSSSRRGTFTEYIGYVLCVQGKAARDRPDSRPNSTDAVREEMKG